MSTTYAETTEAPSAADASLPPERLRKLVRPMPDDGLVGWLAPIGVMLLAGLLRLWRLSIPGKHMFDELYYACDANSLLRHGVERAHGDVNQVGFCVEAPGPAFIVHPPLGKWFIAIGERIFGFNTFGWRISAAVIGTLSVLILCRLGRRLFRSTLLGCVAGLLLTFDGLHFVQSRIAMLDIFVMFWMLAAVACAVVDRDDMRARLAARASSDMAFPGPKLGFRRWRLAAGICLGAGVATKWNALYFVVLVIALSIAWDVGARRTAGVPAPFRATLWRETLPTVGLLLLLPGVIYVASWAGWFASPDGYDRQWAKGSGPWNAWRNWWHYHYEQYHFHANLKSKHSYQSRPWGWLLLARPVSYWYTSPKMGQLGCTVAQCSKEVLGIGTPAIWWASIAALGATLWRWVSRRDWRAGLIMAGFAMAYLPWFRDDLRQRTMFLFYALPAVPFMCLALAMCIGWFLTWGRQHPKRRRWVAGLVGGYLILVVINFAGLYPILAAQVIPYESWHDRMWFTSWI